jgi:hypothetical protein
LGDNVVLIQDGLNVVTSREERIPVSVNARSAEPTVVNAAQADAYASRTDANDLGPWPILRVHSRAIGVALATCLVVLLAVELAVFRSGFFVSHVTVSNPQTPAAKLALAARQPDARVLYVGDSTIMTSVLPSVVSEVCRCGPGFNGGFSAATPWLTDAMTKRLIELSHPRLVVISASPWTVDANARFEDSDLARQLVSPADLPALGAHLDLASRVDASLGSLWSAYGRRELLKEWVGSLAPGQRYDESLRGYWVAAGHANSYDRLVATAGRLFAGVGEPTVSAPGAIVLASLIDELRARGIAVAILVPPLHSTAYEQAGPYLERADATVHELARQRGIPIIDCRASISPTDFRDVTHLVASGAEKHSVCVGEHLRTLVHD